MRIREEIDSISNQEIANLVSGGCIAEKFESATDYLAKAKPIRLAEDPSALASPENWVGCVKLPAALLVVDPRPTMGC